MFCISYLNSILLTVFYSFFEFFCFLSVELCDPVFEQKNFIRHDCDCLGCVDSGEECTVKVGHLKANKLTKFSYTKKFPQRVSECQKTCVVIAHIKVFLAAGYVGTMSSRELKESFGCDPATKVRDFWTSAQKRIHYNQLKLLKQRTNTISLVKTGSDSFATSITADPKNFKETPIARRSISTQASPH